MKIIFALLFSTIITCGLPGLNALPNRHPIIFNLAEQYQHSIFFKIYRIDSINNYYLVYAKHESEIFKIISPKEKIKDCRERVIVGKCYNLDLHSILWANGVSVVPSNSIMELSGWKIDDSTVINFEGDSIRNLYLANNIKGLCIVKGKPSK